MMMSSILLILYFQISDKWEAEVNIKKRTGYGRNQLPSDWTWGLKESSPGAVTLVHNPQLGEIFGPRREISTIIN